MKTLPHMLHTCTWIPLPVKRGRGDEGRGVRGVRGAEGAEGGRAEEGAEGG